MVRIKTLSLVLAIALIATHPNITTTQPIVKVYIFGIKGCELCVKLYNNIVDIVGSENVVFYDISTVNISRRREIVGALSLIQQLLSISLSPDRTLLTGIFIDHKLKVIIIDYKNKEECKSIFKRIPREGILVVGDRDILITNKSLERTLARLFTNPEISIKTTVEGEKMRYNIFPMVLICAAIDSVNPCTFAIFTGLLLTTLYSIGRKKMITTGISFVLGIYLSYFLIGLNLVQVLAIYSLKYIVACLAMIMSAYLLYVGMRGDSPCPLPNPIRSILTRMFYPGMTSIVSTFLMGTVIAISLLPCTSGPYLIALTLLGNLSLIDTLMILMIYNFVFIIPLLAILATAVSLRKVVETLKLRRIKYVRILNIIEAVLLTSLALYVLLH